MWHVFAFSLPESKLLGYDSTCFAHPEAKISACQFCENAHVQSDWVKHIWEHILSGLTESLTRPF